MKLSLLALLLLANLLSAAELRIYTEKRKLSDVSEGFIHSFPLIGKSELKKEEFRILKIIAELETFTEPGLAHPFVGKVYYFALVEDGQQIGRLIQFAHIKESRSGNIYLHDAKADLKAIRWSEENDTKYIPLYSTELGDILTLHLQSSGILKIEKSNQSGDDNSE